MPAAALNPDDLAKAITGAVPQAWTDAKGTPFTGNTQDLQPLILAVSRGLVAYLEAYLHANQGSLIGTLALSANGAAPVANTVAGMTLNITGVSGFTMATPTDPRTQRFLSYPYTVGSTGSPQTGDADSHLRDLILQVLFTIPGERVNLPSFGVGVQQLVFAPNNDTLRTTAQFLIHTGLQQWLGDRLQMIQVTVSSVPGEEEIVTVDIVYAVNATGARQTLQVQL